MEILFFIVLVLALIYFNYLLVKDNKKRLELYKHNLDIQNRFYELMITKFEKE